MKRLWLAFIIVLYVLTIGSLVVALLSVDYSKDKTMTALAAMGVWFTFMLSGGAEKLKQIGPDGLAKFFRR